MDPKPVELNYARPAEPRLTPLHDFISGLSAGRLRSRWTYLQIAWYLGLALLFAAIGFQFGPNLINFGRLSSPTPADFVAEVEEYCVPVVRAMKEFERDHGRLPQDVNELIPQYLPDQKNLDVQLGGVYQGEFRRRGRWNHQIWYDFSAANEGWWVAGAFTRGRVPLPRVIVMPTTAPAIR